MQRKPVLPRCTAPGYTAQWYDNETCTGSPVTGNPVTGKTYYAKWTKSASVALTSTPAAADENGNVSAAYDPDGAVTLSVQNPRRGLALCLDERW